MFPTKRAGSQELPLENYTKKFMAVMQDLPQPLCNSLTTAGSTDQQRQVLEGTVFCLFGAAIMLMPYWSFTSHCHGKLVSGKILWTVTAQRGCEKRKYSHNSAFPVPAL